MPSKEKKIRILFFIGSLRAGGKERRLIELLNYLKDKGCYDMKLVMTMGDIHYPDFYKLNISYEVIEKSLKKNDILIFYKFYKICRAYRPHLIHTWGRIQSLYTIPTVIGQKVPLVNSQITAAPPKLKLWSSHKWIDRINFHFSKFILSNSQAGVDSYKPPQEKVKVIYNGINMKRFANLIEIQQIKNKYGIKTPYTVIMAASFTHNKDYDMFYRVAEKVTNVRDDVTFIGVGGHHKDDSQYKRMLSLSFKKRNIIFPGRIDDVESLVNARTIGVLFSNRQLHGEGISNAIMEYMALSKPVIANDAGGTREIVLHKQNGYLITDQNVEEIASFVIELIDNNEKREAYGKSGKNLIIESFSIESMGKAFEDVYKAALSN